MTSVLNDLNFKALQSLYGNLELVYVEFYAHTIHIRNRMRMEGAGFLSELSWVLSLATTQALHCRPGGTKHVQGTHTRARHMQKVGWMNKKKD